MPRGSWDRTDVDRGRAAGRRTSTLEDAGKLEAVRDALRAGDITRGAQLATRLSLMLVGVPLLLYGRSGRRARTCYPGCLERIRTPSAVYD